MKLQNLCSSFKCLNPQDFCVKIQKLGHAIVSEIQSWRGRLVSWIQTKLGVTDTVDQIATGQLGRGVEDDDSELQSEKDKKDAREALAKEIASPLVSGFSKPHADAIASLFDCALEDGETRETIEALFPLLKGSSSEISSFMTVLRQFSTEDRAKLLEMFPNAISNGFHRLNILTALKEIPSKDWEKSLPAILQLFEGSEAVDPAKGTDQVDGKKVFTPRALTESLRKIDPSLRGAFLDSMAPYFQKIKPDEVSCKLKLDLIQFAIAHFSNWEAMVQTLLDLSSSIELKELIYVSNRLLKNRDDAPECREILEALFAIKEEDKRNAMIDLMSRVEGRVTAAALQVAIAILADSPNS